MAWVVPVWMKFAALHHNPGVVDPVALSFLCSQGSYGFAHDRASREPGEELPEIVRVSRQMVTEEAEALRAALSDVSSASKPG